MRELKWSGESSTSVEEAWGTQKDNELKETYNTPFPQVGANHYDPYEMPFNVVQQLKSQKYLWQYGYKANSDVEGQ